jgi:hypothetical protein
MLESGRRNNMFTLSSLADAVDYGLKMNESVPQQYRDYDYVAGAMDAWIEGRPFTNEAQHWTDAGKLPNHPSFSRESWYSTEQDPGGQWVQTDKGWGFVPHDLQFMDTRRYNRLLNYLDAEAGRGIDYIQLPNQQVFPKQLMR